MVNAYDIASSEARNSAERQKREIGDRVLVKNVGIKGKQKLADLWKHCVYKVKKQPIPAIPVYEVVRENAPGSKPRVLHRYMLLPFFGLPFTRTHAPEKEKK